MKIDRTITPESLLPAVQQVFELAARKARRLDRRWDRSLGTPVFTVRGEYTSRGWTEWTQGFQYGCLLLAGDGLDDTRLVNLGRKRTFELMLPHVTHTGVHDHGFNNLSTYGNLLRLACERGRGLGRSGDIPLCRQALAVSGAVQASRWSRTADGGGYIYSFNGPHSLFIDTLRSTRILGVAHALGHVLMGENDLPINLLGRCVQHGLTTDRYLVFHGESTHTYDVRGRTAHEGLFNCNDGQFRARSTQQGYSPFSTWTRGLGWAMLGFAEELEFFNALPSAVFPQACGLPLLQVAKAYRRAAVDTCEHYIRDVSTADGLVYWDDGAPNLHKLGDWASRPAEPFNEHEPVDSSAAAIAAQGLLRLGRVLGARQGRRYRQAGLSVASALFREPYLSTHRSHEGLLLHSVYHWPNHWDYCPDGMAVPHGESSLWGDYHLLELALLIQRMGTGGEYPTFFGGVA